MAVVPMVTRNKVIGLIVVDNKFSQSPITHEDLEALLVFANTAAIAVDNFRLFQQNKVAREQLHSLYKASLELISSKTRHEVLQEIVERTCEAAGATWVRLILVDEMGRARVLKTAGDTEEVTLDEVMRPDGIAERVMRTGEAEVIRDKNNHICPINPVLMQDSMVSALCLPLTLQGRQLGVMWISYDQPRHFPNFEVEALRLYVNQTAVAYDNARRLDELEHMRQVADALAGARDFRDALDQIVNGAVEVLGAESVVLLSYDAVRGQFIRESSLAKRLSEEEWNELWKEEPKPGATAYTVMKEGYKDILDVSNAEEYGFISETTRALLGKMGVKSFQGIALSVGEEEKLGVLYVNYNRLRHFSEDDQQAAKTFANHAALALKKAKLLDQVRIARNTAKVVAEMTALEELGGTITSIVSGTREALGADAVTLYRYDADRDEFDFPPAMEGVKKEEYVRGLGRVSDPSVVRRILGLDDLHVAPDTRHDALMQGPFVEREEIASSVGVPLISGNRKVGVMFINYWIQHRFTEDELTNIRLFANQAAVAIRNQQLYERLKRRAKSLEILHEAGQAITGSLNLQKILELIANQAWLLASYQGKENIFVDIKLIDSGKAKIGAVYPQEEWQNIFEKLGAEIDLVKGIGDKIGIVGRAVKNGSSCLVNQVKTDKDYVGLREATNSQMVVLIKKEQTVIGAISVEHPDHNAFDTNDLNVLNLLAAQASIAIENARQYADLKNLKGYVGNRTALEWMKMVSFAWGHSIRREVGTALSQIFLIEGIDDIEQIQSEVKMLKEVLQNIKEIPIVAPLSSEEHFLNPVLVNDLVKTYLEHQRTHTPYKLIDVCLHLQDNLDSLKTVRASRAWLRNALEILVENAARAMIEADSSVKTLTTTTWLDEKWVKISIKDTGPGIPEAILKKIFKEPVTETEGARGAGVGLVLAYTIIQTYGGNIDVKSDGSGTDMVISLPAESQPA
jgi:GAF domain-containing protein